MSRFFAPGSGIDEDPVTGSAHTALGPYWAGRSGQAGVHGVPGVGARRRDPRAAGGRSREVGRSGSDGDDWRVTRLRQDERRQAAHRGLSFIWETSLDDGTFDAWSGDFLWCFHSISATAKEAGLRARAREMGAHAARRWHAREMRDAGIGGRGRGGVLRRAGGCDAPAGRGRRTVSGAAAGAERAVSGRASIWVSIRGGRLRRRTCRRSAEGCGDDVVARGEARARAARRWRGARDTTCGAARW